jgi:hypothetical protein
MTRSAPRLAVASAGLALLLTLASCAVAPTPRPTTTEVHGFDAGGAAEVASPALALVIADEEGALTLIDLDTEERAEFASPGDVTAVSGDGRLIYRALADDAGVEVTDTARWTVPHGDHTHSFRGDARSRGTLDGTGDVRVTAGGQRASVAFGGSSLVVLDHEELGAGLESADPVAVMHTGPVVPFAGGLLVPADRAVAATDLSGAALDASAPCRDASDADVTRVGAVFACADGAVLFTREVGGTVAAEVIPFPADAPPATDLAGRTDRPDLAGVAGSAGAWLLDVRQRRWTFQPSDVPLLRAVAVGDDDSRTVAVDAEGRVRILAADGSVLARTEPLLADAVSDPALRERVQLVVGGRHAYLADPALGAVHEIDHTDARITRSFDDLDPSFLQLVG